MDGRDHPLSTADIAGSRSDGEDQPEMAGAQTEGDPTAVNLTGQRAGTAQVSGTAQAAGTAGQQPQALLDDEETGTFRARWETIQTGFVDEPRRSVEEADELVAAVMQRLAETFARARQDLEAQWAGGGQVGTEELRVALQRYRSFFETLLRR